MFAEIWKALEPGVRGPVVGVIKHLCLRNVAPASEVGPHQGLRPVKACGH